MKKVILFLTLLLAWQFTVCLDDWFLIGPGGGGYFTKVISPVEKLVFAGSDVGGVLKSVDGGISWVPYNEGLKNYFVTDLIYIETTSTLIASTLGGIYSRTGEEMWVNISVANAFPTPEWWDSYYSSPKNCIALDPDDYSILYCGIGIPADEREFTGKIKKHAQKGSVYRRANGIWQKRSTDIDTLAIIHSIAIAPEGTPESRTIFIATDKGIYKSNDSGINWTSMNNGIPDNNGCYGTRKIILDNDNSNRLFVTVWSEQSGIGGVYKSENGGDSWFESNTGLNTDFSSAAWTNRSNYREIVIDPNNSSILYTGNTTYNHLMDPGVFKSENGGESWFYLGWNTKNVEQSISGWIDFWEPSVKCIGVSNVGDVFFGTTGALYKSNNPSSYEDWEGVYSNNMTSIGLETTVIRDIKFDEENTMYVAAMDIGLLKKNEGESGFTHISYDLQIWDNSAYAIVISDDKFFLATNDNNSLAKVYRKLQNDSFQDLKLPVGSSDSVYAIDYDGTSNTLYAATNHSNNGKIYKNNIDTVWVDITNNFGTSTNIEGVFNRSTRCIKVHPENASIIFAGTEHYWLDQMKINIRGGLFRSIDGGGHWERVGDGIGDVWDIVFHPVDPNIIYVATRYFSIIDDYWGGIFVSSDGGDSWRRSTPLPSFNAKNQLNFSSIIISPKHPHKIYASTFDENYKDISSGKGIFEFDPETLVWTSSALSNGSTVQSSYTIAFYSQNYDEIVIGTAGNGLLLVNAQPELNVNNYLNYVTQLRNYPNPFNPETIINFSIREETNAKLMIYNIRGQIVRMLHNGLIQSGEHSIVWNGTDDKGRDVGSGVYFYRLRTDHYDKVNKLLLVK